jgi:site-specific recombinase XerD
VGSSPTRPTIPVNIRGSVLSTEVSNPAQGVTDEYIGSVSKTKLTAPDALQGLLPDWRISLRARGRSLATIASYLSVGESFTGYLSAKGMPDGAGTIAREHVEQYLADMRDRGLSPATVAKHYRSLQQLFKWLTADGEIPRSPMAPMSPPSVPEQPVPVLDGATLSALLATCKGNTFENRRDTAIVRLLLDTGMRAGELCGLEVEDLDFEHQVALVVGKGGRNRACPFGSKSADALRRYLRFPWSSRCGADAAALAGQEGADDRLRRTADARTPLR